MKTKTKKKPAEQLVQASMYLTPHQIERLRQLSESTHVSGAVYVRAGVDAVLANPALIVTTPVAK